MNRLQAELKRLYVPHDAERQDPGSDEPGLAGPDGRVRAMVLELARPASWDGLAKAWRGVQVDLELPAPAIAVTGIDGYQLWFSLSQPVPAAQAIAFLELVRGRYLGDIPQERVAMTPCVDASPSTQGRNGAGLPPMEAAPGRWSAFVAPDLAAVFADEPWLDLPPGPEAQADLLSRLEPTKPDELKRALERLRRVDTQEFVQAAPAPADAAVPESGQRETRPAAADDHPDPRRFLVEIMNDRAVELHLRIEAAKALLPYFDGERPL